MRHSESVARLEPGQESPSAAKASESQKAFSTIVLDNIAVPAGETLDLSDLEDGTKVSIPYKHDQSSW